MTERHAAIHATCALGACALLRKFTVDLKPVIDPFRDGPALGQLGCIFKKAGYLAHAAPPSLISMSGVGTDTFAELRDRPSARLYSWGKTFTNLGNKSSQYSRIHFPSGL